ncbi:MAG: glycosyltransferase [Promicromonosporaceae bacterium]|nr:glycosyltransferase [Promicromonosporaceae bacterium]
MFEIDLPPLESAEPWRLPLSERLQMLRAEPVKVAYYYHHPDAATFRYRCYNMARAINAHVPGVSASWFWDADGARLLDVAKEVDVLVLCRAVYRDTTAQVVDAARRFGACVFYDIDDLYFDPASIPLMVDTLGLREDSHEATEEMWTHRFGTAARHRAVMEMADEVIVTNDYLAGQVRERLPQPVRVIPNFMGDDQLAVSEAVVAARGEPRADGRLHLGYFSGTPTHSRDFALVAGAMARLLRRREDVALRLVGHIDLGCTVLADFADRVEVVPYVGYLELQRVIGQTEVNIAPLQNNSFTNCKSELKYFDAAAVGIPTLASPTFAMSRAIDHERTGLLVPDPEWDHYLDLIVDEYNTLGRSLGQVARNHALTTYTPTTQAPTIAALIDPNPGG